MIKVLPLINIALIACIYYLKWIESAFIHWYYRKLSVVYQVPDELKSAFLGDLTRLSITTKIVALLTITLAVVILKKQLAHRTIGIVLLVASTIVTFLTFLSE